MTQVSKYPIHKDVEKRIDEIFKKSISYLKTSEDIEDFLHDFLSPVEKIMLGKRLSIAVLLSKGYNYGQIGRILRVTPPTIASVSIALKYSGKGYKKIVDRISNADRREQFWQKIDDILINIPASKGSDWSYQRRKYEEEKRKKRKIF
ncbi:MAG: trp operon repressor [Patescibacteria group bacterium]|nr:trp operon repressor [Patescibacteria group bacterium]